MSLRFWRRRRKEQELDEEIRSHLQMAAQDRMESGESRPEAESAARREFGNTGLVKEVAREEWGLGWIERLLQDLRYGFRILWKNPIYALVSVITLALGIGASTAIFSVVYGVILRSLPYNKPEQIVRVWEVNSKGSQMSFADPNFDDLREQSHSLQGMAELAWGGTTVSMNGQAGQVPTANVSKDFFSVMGVAPVMGRLFVPEDQHLGAAPTAVVSYSYWQRNLRGATDLSAINLSVSRKPTTVIAVLPPGFHFPENTDIWLARETDEHLPSRSAHNWRVIARLRDGTSLDQARMELSALAHRIRQKYGPDDLDMVDTAIMPLREAMTVDVKPALLVLLGVAGLLLLVACANVMNLSLAQASARAGELAVRTALGASRWRLVRQFLAEALLLCVIGGCFGILAAQFGVRILLALAPSSIPRLNEVSVSLPVLLFALGVSIVVAAGLGTLTALRATSGNVQSALSEAARGQGSALRSQRTGRMIVVGQVAVTLTLLVGAGLLARSMLRVLSIYPGYQTEHLLTLSLHMPAIEPAAKAQRAQFLEQLLSRLQSISGVQSAGGITDLPLHSQSSNGKFVVVNELQLSAEQKELMDRIAHSFTWPPAGAIDPAVMKSFQEFFTDLWRDPSKTGQAEYAAASEGYFQALGIPLLRGRLFTDSDSINSPHVALISESLAGQRWPGQDPLGQTIEFGNMDGDPHLLTVIGVVGDVRENLESDPKPTVYVNYRQRPNSTWTFDIALRTNSDPDSIFSSARQILSQLDPTIPPRFDTFTQILSASLNGRRFNLVLVAVFAGAALLLAMAGIFGVLAYSVARRTREIGVRIALGATSANVLRLVLQQALKTAVVGIVMGIPASLLLTRTIRSLLFETSPADPVTLAAVTLLLMLVALLASYVPARRATRVDPIVALRYE